MAFAEVVYKPQVTVVDVERIRLDITREEAVALVAVLGRVGGHPDTTRRGLISNLYNALLDADDDLSEEHEDATGSVYFQVK